jgi:hypothetical protein
MITRPFRYVRGSSLKLVQGQQRTEKGDYIPGALGTRRLATRSAVADAELIETIPREAPRVPEKSLRAEPGKSEALPAVYPAIGIPHLKRRVDRGKQPSRSAHVWIDHPQITRCDDDRVALVGVKACELQPSESWLEVPHPGTRFRPELHDNPFASETTPFARERDRRRPIRWQAVKNSYSGNHLSRSGGGLARDEDGDGVGVADAVAVARHRDAEAIVAKRGGEDPADLVGVARQRE